MVFFYLAQLAFSPAAGLLGLIPLAGILCAVAGLWLAWRRPSWRLAWLAVPFVASELLVLSTGLAPGRLSASQANWVLGVFFWGMVAVAAGLIWYVRGHRPAATVLGVAGVTYAFVACFLSYMGFTGDWI